MEYVTLSSRSRGLQSMHIYWHLTAASGRCHWFFFLCYKNLGHFSWIEMPVWSTVTDTILSKSVCSRNNQGFWMMYPVCSMESAEGTKLCCIAFKPLLTHINFVPLLFSTWGRSHVAPHILNLCMRWGREVSFVPYPLYQWKIALTTHWLGGWVDTIAGLGFWRRENFLLCKNWTMILWSPSLA